MGPNEPMPMASRGWRALKKATTRPIVSCGVPVGNSAESRSPGWVPTAQTNLVPPASMPPKRAIGPVYGGLGGEDERPVTIGDGMRIRTTLAYPAMLPTFAVAQQTLPTPQPPARPSPALEAPA